MNKIIDQISAELEDLKKAGKFKTLPVIENQMGPVVKLADGTEAVNFCSNNYLGLASHPEVVKGAKSMIDRHGSGTASVRFICGTFAGHLELEKKIAAFTGMEAATTYVSCWCANEALMPTLIQQGDCVISDELNHASIIDACRLATKISKTAKLLVYKHSNMQELEARLQEAKDCRRVLIITDGVFSMEGDLAKLPEIIELGKKYGALVAVDDSHGHGVVGKTGRGTCEHFGVKADIITGTLGKAIGGAAGGFIAGPQPIIEYMIQRSRPQLFSNALPPAVIGGAMAALNLIEKDNKLVTKLHDNVNYLRTNIKKLGYKPLESETAIIPVIIGDAAKTAKMAKAMLQEKVLITGFWFPVVPEGAARLRIQVSAAHTKEHLDHALKAFEKLKTLAM